MGQPRKPAPIREAEGNRGNRPIPREIACPGHPEPPGHLTAEQRARWDDVVGSLPFDLLKRADTQVLERMAVAWAAFREATILINKSGLITRGRDGNPVRNPLLVVQNVAAGEMDACGAMLGLSPVARTRLTTPENVENMDPLAVLLGPNGKAWSDERQLKN